MRYGMVIDLKKCVGCNACTIACRSQNGTPAGINFNKTKKYEVGRYPTAKMKSLPMPCMHCQNPPCLKVCPTFATHQNEGGIVTIDKEKCIGCRACIIACPYESRQFIWKINNYYENQKATPYEKLKFRKFERGTVAKCIFCIDRVREGLPPACVHTCISEARIFGDLDNPESDVSRLIALHQAAPFRGEPGTEPSVFYING